MKPLPLPKKVYDDTIAHYDRMIAWVKTQEGTVESSRIQMRVALHETWKGDGCPICTHYEGRCWLCDIGDGCAHTPWIHMSHAKTWHT